MTFQNLTGYKYALQITILLLSLLIGQIPSLSVLANDEDFLVDSLSQSDLNGDGMPDLTIIDCAFSSNADRIYVVDQAGDMKTSTSWQEATDFNNDIWLYDTGADGSIQLIVVYRVEDSQNNAYLYDDQDGDGKVDYSRSGTVITIEESKFWSAKITSNGYWIKKDNKVNLDISILFDGPFPLFARMPDYVRQTYLLIDGKADAEYEILVDDDGIARNSMMRLLTPVPEYYIFQRSVIFREEGGFSWPESLTFFPISFIGMDWQKGKITGYGNNLAFTGQSSYCSNNNTIQKNTVNVVSFECPNANYDLANDGDSDPELQIRMYYSPPGNPGFPVPLLNNQSSAVENIYYSWNMPSQNAWYWDYKIGLAGTYNITDIEQYKDFKLKKVPYADFPRWIAGRDWKLTTFVARENTSIYSSEGIWNWDPFDGPNEGDPSLIPQIRSASLQYMLGISAQSPDAYFTSVNSGLRAERNFSGPSKPQLYVSPIDHRLHLEQAQWGIWNIGEGKTIRYQNLDGDGYIDQWQYSMGDTLIQQMNQAQGSLVVSGIYQVRIKLTDTSFAVFETQPPGNHDEWVKLGEQLDANKSDLAGNDFTGMLETLPGDTLVIDRATLRDYRPTSTGYRFVLGLEPGFTFEGPDWLGLRSLAAGEYVVSYAGGQFTTQALTPAALTLSVVMDENAVPTQLAYEQVGVNLANLGLDDASQVVVELGARQAGGEISWSEVQTTTVLAGETTKVVFDWSPRAEGVWQVQAKVHTVDAQGVPVEALTASQQVMVKPAEASTLQEDISAFGVIAPWQAGLLMACVVVMAALTGWYLFKSVGQADENSLKQGDGAEIKHNDA